MSKSKRLQILKFATLVSLLLISLSLSGNLTGVSPDVETTSLGEGKKVLFGPGNDVFNINQQYTSLAEYLAGQGFVVEQKTEEIRSSDLVSADLVFINGHGCLKNFQMECPVISDLIYMVVAI